MDSFLPPEVSDASKDFAHLAHSISLSFIQGKDLRKMLAFLILAKCGQEERTGHSSLQKQLQGMIQGFCGRLGTSDFLKGMWHRGCAKPNRH